MAERIQATSLSEADCNAILKMLITGREGAGTGRFAKLTEAIGFRDQHFHNAKEANPTMAAPFQSRQVFQTDAIRRTYVQAQTRLLEHTPAFHVVPKKQTAEWKKAANALEQYLTRGLAEVEERNGYRLQGFVGHGQLIHCYGVLRCVATRGGKMPDKKRLPSLDGVPSEERSMYAQTESGYEEKDSSLLDRYREQKASEPFPFVIDVPRSDTVAFIPDRGNPSGFAVFVTAEEVSSLDYNRQIWKQDGFDVRLGANKQLNISMPGTRPISTDPSGGSEWGNLKVFQVWTDSECYELASGGDAGSGDATLIKSFKHTYGCPAFALIPATITNHPDPLYRYRPYLDGQFKTKPQYDMERNLGRLIAEETVIPRYWVELKEGGYWLDDTGQPLVLEQNSALAQKMPEGAKLVRADVKIEPAFIEFLDRSKQDLVDATPQTGYAESVGASTQPHAIYMQTIQSNAGIADLKRKQVRGFEQVFQMVVEQMARWADDGDPIVLRTPAGELIEPSAEMLRGMTVGVKIEENSGAQQVSKEQYLRDKSKDPAAVYTTAEYLEETGREDPESIFAQWLAEKAKMRVWPMVMDQELAKAYGDAYVLTPAGTAVGIDGQPADPLTVIAMHGFQALAQAETGQGMAGGPVEPALPSGGPPPLAPIQPMEVPASESAAASMMP